MPKVTEAYRHARRNEIADAALRCFAVKGFHRTSMADIIAESGLSAGAIYGHFDSKESLLATVAERVLTSRSSELEERRGSEGPLSPGEILVVILRGMRDETFDPGILIQVWAEAAINPDVRAVLQSVLTRIRATLGPHVTAWAAVNPEQAGDDPEAYAQRTLPVLMGLLPGFLLQRVIVADFDEDAYLRELPQLLPH